MEIRAPRGTQKTCQTWEAEAALRCLMNNLDPEVAEDPSNLIVYGGSGRAARSWDAYHAIVRSLKSLAADETLLIQSGKPVGAFRTHPGAPRVLIANSNLVPHWATAEEFRRLESLGLIMYGQMTAGSWIYIGTQGILQGTYETFMALAAQHYQSELAGRWILTGGLGGMGGAQPLAATMAGASMLAIEVDPQRIQKRLDSGYLHQMETDLERALELVRAAAAEKRALSVGLVGNCAELLPQILARGIVPDILTDQTSAHDALQGYVPAGMSLAEAVALRAADPESYIAQSMASMRRHVETMVAFQERGAITFDYGNNIRGQAELAGYEQAFAFPGFVPAYIRPLFCEGKGPFRWVALSGDPEDIYRIDSEIEQLFPENAQLLRWIRMAREQVHFQGLPARICWLGYGDRAKLGLRINELVGSGEVSAPIAIGRDHLDCGSVASPNRETEAMRDGSDAIADWPLLNAMLNAVSGAAWVSLHHGGGVGIGYSIHAGQVSVADGTPEAAARLERVLTCDPGMGIIRHADAGYPEALKNAQAWGVRVPMEEGS